VRRLLVVSLVGLALAAQAAVGGSAPRPRRLGPFGWGADAYWLWRAPGVPKSVVVFLHGLDRSELTPANHLPWIEHLARQGDDVIYRSTSCSPASAARSATPCSPSMRLCGGFTSRGRP
jgi:hypothetical protein